MDRTTYYKFRSTQNFKYLIDILVNQRLYASTYKNLNDAMEGIYIANGLKPSKLKSIKEGKELIKICSLSTDKEHPLLWGHYADGSRGICIGLKITGHNLDKKQIIYDGIPEIRKVIDDKKTVKEILTHKDSSWEYEKELRIFTEKDYVKIHISEIIFGSRISVNEKKLIQKIVCKFCPDAILSEQK